MYFNVTSGVITRPLIGIYVCEGILTVRTYGRWYIRIVRSECFATGCSVNIVIKAVCKCFPTNMNVNTVCVNRNPALDAYMRQIVIRQWPSG